MAGGRGGPTSLLASTGAISEYDTYDALGLAALVRKGDHEGARRQLLRALKLRPDFTAARRGLAEVERLLAEQGR